MCLCERERHGKKGRRPQKTIHWQNLKYFGGTWIKFFNGNGMRIYFSSTPRNGRDMLEEGCLNGCHIVRRCALMLV